MRDNRKAPLKIFFFPRFPWQHKCMISFLTNTMCVKKWVGRGESALTENIFPQFAEWAGQRKYCLPATIVCFHSLSLRSRRSILHQCREFLPRDMSPLRNWCLNDSFTGNVLVEEPDHMISCFGTFITYYRKNASACFDHPIINK